MSEKAPHHNYVKIYGILLALLVVSVVGPMLEIQIITLITAFGIAGVKAYIVCKYFMHLDTEPAFIRWILITAVVIMVVLFYGVAPDVMQDDGQNWHKNAEIEWHETSEAYRANHAGESQHGGATGQH